LHWFFTIDVMKKNEQKILQTILLMKNKNVNKSFEVWYNYTIEIKKMKRQLHQVTAKFTKQLESKLLNTWIHYVDRRILFRNFLRHRSETIKRHLLDVHMKIWYRQSMSMLRIENNCLNGLNILNKMIKRKERKIIKTSFSFWKKKNRHHINFQNKINKFYKNNCRVTLRRYYNTWVDVLYHTLHIQSIFKRSLQRFNSNRLSLCWYNWNDYIDTVNLYKNKIQNFCNIYDKYIVTANRNLLTSCYLKWKLKSNFSVSIDALIDQKTYDTKRVLLIRSTIYKLRTLSTNSLGNALRKWKTKTEEHRRYMYKVEKNVQLIVRYIQFNFKNVKSQAWNIWLAFCRYKAHVEHLLYTARSRWKHQIVSSSYRTWYIHVHASIRQRNQIKLLFLRVIHKTKFHFINKWKRFVTQQKKKTFKFKLFMEKWQMKQETVEKLCIKHVFNKLMYNIYFSRIIELSTIKNEDTKNRKFKLLRRFLKKKKRKELYI